MSGQRRNKQVFRPERTIIAFMSKLWLLLALGILNVGGVALADQGSALLRVHFVDVGQGDAIWIQGPAGECTPEGLNIIIDGGPDTGKANRLITYLEAYKLKAGSIVDYAILTHPHDDHYPGMLDVLANYQVRTIIDSGFPKEGPKFATFVKAAGQEKIGNAKSDFVELRKRPGFQIPTSGCTDLKMSIVFADSDRPGLGTGSNRENNASTVVRIEYKGFSFLFMGDLEGTDRDDESARLSLGEKALLASAAPGAFRSTVLKVGHHGSKTSSTPELIRAVAPDVIVVQSGRKFFGGTPLPDKAVLERYKKERPNALIVRTDEGDEAAQLTTINDADGDDIAVLTDGDTLRVRQARLSGGKRRWVTLKTIQK